MKQARIAIAAGIGKEEGEIFQGYPKVMVMEAYCRAVEETGGIPFVIAPSFNEKTLEAQLDDMDALVLTGGADIAPQLYKEEPLPKIFESNPTRDRFDWALLKIAVDKKMPIFGVCRGLQMMNAFFGGSLWQDLSYSEMKLRHSFHKNPETPVHHVKVEKDSFLFRACQKERLEVNSVHHQAIRELAPGFKAVAHAADGCVEAIECTREGDPFIAAVQWHPEMLMVEDEDSRNIFKYFIQAAAEKALSKQD